MLCTAFVGSVGSVGSVGYITLNSWVRDSTCEGDLCDDILTQQLASCIKHILFLNGHAIHKQFIYAFWFAQREVFNFDALFKRVTVLIC